MGNFVNNLLLITQSHTEWIYFACSQSTPRNLADDFPSFYSGGDSLLQSSPGARDPMKDNLNKLFDGLKSLSSTMRPGNSMTTDNHLRHQ